MKVFSKVSALVFLISFYVSANAFSQNLTVNTSQLNFGNAFENAPDSLQLIITNSTGRSVTITGIKFYNTYGSPAFSTATNSFVISDGASSNIWIKFSPRHNIFHNSEMVIENDGLRGFTSVDLLGQGKFSNQYYDPTENFSEENLKNIFNVITGNGYVSLGYNVARDSMFMSIDNKRVNGQGASQNTLECVYTGREAVGYTSRADCQTTFSFNTEHTLPQSLFASMEPMKSDLHHLFPTDDVANNQRGDNPFGVVSTPTWNNGGSSSDGFTFEPRDKQKGVAARALFYFVLRYQNYSNFVTPQESILRTWCNAFPPDNIERKRNDDINRIQHNRNPFVDYPVFLERINSITSNSVTPLVSSIDLTQDTINFGTIGTGIPVTFNYVIVNNGNTDINFSNFNLTHSSELSFASGGGDTSIAPGESLPVQIRCITTTADSIRAFLTFTTNASGNNSVTIPIFVNDLIFSGIKNITDDGIIISPNPSRGIFSFSSIRYPGETTFEILDITGKRILKTHFSEAHQFDLSGFDKGIYLLRIYGNAGVSVKKIVIE